MTWSSVRRTTRRCPRAGTSWPATCAASHDDVATMPHPERLERADTVDGASRSPASPTGESPRCERARLRSPHGSTRSSTTPTSSSRLARQPVHRVSARSRSAERSSPSTRRWDAHRSKRSSTRPVNPPLSSRGTSTAPAYRLRSNSSDALPTKRPCSRSAPKSKRPTLGRPPTRICDITQIDPMSGFSRRDRALATSPLCRARSSTS